MTVFSRLFIILYVKGEKIMEHESVQTIELDCPPGNPRPCDLLPSVIEGTGLTEREPVSALFGNWKWDYSDVDPMVWKQAQPVISKRIIDLYDKGKIRYGSW